jgi:DNA-directed RNA polymerase specialized sigma24 family protein
VAQLRPVRSWDQLQSLAVSHPYKFPIQATAPDQAEGRSAVSGRGTEPFAAGKHQQECRGRAAFARLSPEHREVMQLAVVEGFEIREIGEMLRIPPGTVMSRLSRAQLRTVLQAVRPSPKETL